MMQVSLTISLLKSTVLLCPDVKMFAALFGVILANAVVMTYFSITHF